MNEQDHTGDFGPFSERGDMRNRFQISPSAKISAKLHRNSLYINFDKNQPD